MNKILVILGPTATGKTDIALELAKKINGELISVDSRQVYKKLDLGTGKLPGKQVKYTRKDGYWIIDNVKVWMYDVVSPQERYHISKYVKDSNDALQKIIKVGKLPILVGGTGFYLKGLLEGFSTINIPTNETLREKLQKSRVEEIQKKLINLSADTFNKMNNSDQKNPRRLIRQIELLSTPSPESIKVPSFFQNYDILKIGLTAPRPVLNNRIDQRVDKRIKSGMLKEAQTLLKNGLPLTRFFELGLEYKILAEFLEGKLNHSQMVTKLKNKIHQFAKRQMTWFKKDNKIYWFDITDKSFQTKLEKRLFDWYNSPR